MERGSHQCDRVVLGDCRMLHDSQTLALGTKKQEEICEAGSGWEVRQICTFVTFLKWENGLLVNEK